MEAIHSKDISIEETREVSTISNTEELSKIIEWVHGIREEATKESCLAELSRKRESFSDLAIYIWYSPGIVSCLLQEIINTYSLLAPPILNIQSSNRACNVLALFQCVAAHPETRPAFLTAQIPIFFYPFLNTVNKNKPFEYLRLTALGVIGALVKIDNPEVIGFLLSTEIIPLCLRIMERGSELSKTVATFIVQRILLDENGLNYVCNTAERFYAISSVLYNMINSTPSPRLIKHIIRSYARLSENSRVRSILKENLPAILKDKTFQQSLDESSKRWLHNLLKSIANIQTNDRSSISIINGLSNVGSSGNMNNILRDNPFDMMQGGNGYLYNNGYGDYMDASTNMNNNMMNSNMNNINLNNVSGNSAKGQGYGVSNGRDNKNYLNLNGNVFTYKNGK